MTEGQAPTRPPIHKRRWFIVVAAVAVMGFFGALLDSGESELEEGATTTIPREPTATTQPSEPSTTLKTSGAFMILEIVVFDWTENVPPGDVLVGVGNESWQPNLEFGGDLREFGEYKIGLPGSFEVYPDGIGDTQIVVEFVMTDEMISGSVMSQTHVEIYDTEILVWGQAIPGLEETFDR